MSAQTSTTTTTTTTTAVPTTPDTPPPPAPFPNAFNAPPCDFSNTFYEENGILAHVPGDSLNQKVAGRFGLFRLGDLYDLVKARHEDRPETRGAPLDWPRVGEMRVARAQPRTTRASAAWSWESRA